MYSKRSNLILGFHGCDEKVAQAIVSGEQKMKPSNNDYDWLGGGYYFWENNYLRALQFANEQQERQKSNSNISKIETPAILGAVIDLGYCLDLLDSENLQLVKSSFEIMKAISEKEELELPENKSTFNSQDFLIRKLDCAVIQNIHELNKKNKIQPYDSVRGVFWEGDDIYLNAGFKEKNHIQICICNPNCIKGFFLQQYLNTEFNKP